MLNRLLHLSLHELMARDGQLIVKRAPEKKFSSLSFALVHYFNKVEGELPDDVADFLEDEKELAKLKKGLKSKAKMLKRAGIISDSPLKQVLDECIVMTRTEGRAGEIWVKAKTGGYFYCGIYTDDKLLDIVQYALRYETFPDILIRLSEMYHTAVEFSEMNDTKPNKKEITFDQWLIGYLKEYRAEFRVYEGSMPKITWTPEETPGIVSFDIVELKKHLRYVTPTPHWDEFLNRLDHPNEFKAWVWSLFSGDMDTRQILWIMGKGNDGKSTVTRALRRMLGPDVTSSINIKDSNQFTAYQYLNKRFAIESDARYGEIIDDPLIFKLSGCDPMTIEPKGKNAFTAILTTHVMICANIPPKIDTYADSQTSRLLFLKVSSIKDTTKEAIEFADDSFEDKLFEEKYQFLASCKQAHHEFATKDNRIKMTDAMRKSIRTECKAMRIQVIEDDIEENYDIADPTESEAKIKEVEYQRNLFRAMKKFGLRRGEGTYNNAINYLKYGVGCIIDDGFIYGLKSK